MSPIEIGTQQLRTIADAITQRSSPAHAYLYSTPSARDPHALLSHLAAVVRLRDEIDDMRVYLPERLYTQWRLPLMHLIESLDKLQYQLNSLVDGAPTRNGRLFVYLKGGGREIYIDPILLGEMVRVGMKDEEIRRRFDCSLRTIKRRIRRAGLTRRNWDALTIDDIMTKLYEARASGSGLQGERALRAYLKNHQVKIPRSKFREALSFMPGRNNAPLTCPFVRRIYRVPWINALWHIDGHHKMIRWKLVVHAGIDGFSHMVTFCRVSDNNRASTVLEAFNYGVARYGLPSRVRADYGKENWDVKKLMETERGAERRSFIMGPSTRNQRIERLWVDLRQWTSSRFEFYFKHLEERGDLDVDNPFHMWVLHFCYLPVLRQSMDNFVATWNAHQMSTEGEASPELIWLRNRLDAAELGLDPVGLTALHERENPDEMLVHSKFDFQSYGEEDYGPRPPTEIKDTDPHVIVDDVLLHVPEHVASFLEDPGLGDVLYSMAGRFPLHSFAEDGAIPWFLDVKRALGQVLDAAYPNMATNL